MRDNIIRPTTIKCFICNNGSIWSIDDNGKSNYPAPTRIEGNKVIVFHPAYTNEVAHEFQLHLSLTDLAIAVEHEIPESKDGSVSLYQAVAESHKQTQKFLNSWLLGNHSNPLQYPIVLPEENAGSWFEQMNDMS